MRMSTALASAVLITVGWIGLAAAQPHPVPGTARSLFPHAAPHEVQIIDGVPCRTMYDRQLKTRFPVACAGEVHVPHVDVHTTGSTVAGAAAGAPLTGTPGSPFPYASPHEVKMINGVPCRTMYDAQLRTRVPIQCAGDVMVRRIR